MKNKNTNKKKEKTVMSKNTKVLLLALAGLAFLLVIIFVIIESLSSRVVVNNKSGKKLEYVKAYFVDMEDQFTETLLIENLEPGDQNEIKINKIDCTYRQANLEVRFKFEDYDEMFVDAGYFNDEFDGKITIKFSDTEDDKVLLKVKASAGILPTPNIICNEEFVVNLEEGYVEE